MATVATSRVVHARAPGRITLFLEVGRFGSDGEHEVATAYQAVSLFDEVRATEAEGFSATVGGITDIGGSVRKLRGGFDDAGVQEQPTDVPADGHALAIKAARMLARSAGYAGGAHLEIINRAPSGSGIGTAGADAAATLLALDELWQTGYGKDELTTLARKLGPEVEFAFTGGTAIGTSRDAELSQALAEGQFHWVIAVPDFDLDAPAVLQALKDHRTLHSLDISPATEQPQVERGVLHAIRAGNCHMLAESLHNDLQAAAFRLDPRLAELLEAGEENGALAGILTGSGPSIAFLAEDADSALALHQALANLGHDVVRVVGPVHGARLVEP